MVKVGEDYAEFSAAVDSGDRTIIQAVSAIVEGPRAAGGIRLIDPKTGVIPSDFIFDSLGLIIAIPVITVIGYIAIRFTSTK